LEVPSVDRYVHRHQARFVGCGDVGAGGDAGLHGAQVIIVHGLEEPLGRRRRCLATRRLLRRRSAGH
jgi:hypothetical protein